jgi:hypothetical protein
MKSKTFWELIFLAIASYPALHYLGVYLHALDNFKVASIAAPIAFLAIAIFVAISDRQPNV